MSEILRQLSAWASRASGVRLESITPSQPVPSTGAQALPIALSVKGHYFRLAKFMHLLRLEAGVKDGKAHASGRLYGIDNIALSTGGQGRPVTATLALDAFVGRSRAVAQRRLRRRRALAAAPRPDGSSRTPRDRRSRPRESLRSSAARRSSPPCSLVALAVLLAYESPHLLKSLQRHAARRARDPPHRCPPAASTPRHVPSARRRERPPIRSQPGAVAAER